MKRIIYTMVIATTLSIGIISYSCNSPSKKAEKARENVQEAQRELNETKAEAELQQQKAATAEQWKAFKSDSEIKIKENETRIAELKAKKMKPGKMLDSIYQKRIDELELKNNNLRTKISVYENNQSDWESFKNEFNHDIDELGKAFKDIAVDNEK